MYNPIVSWAKSLYSEIEDISNGSLSKQELRYHRISGVAHLVPTLGIGVISVTLAGINFIEGDYLIATLYRTLGLGISGPIVGYGKKCIEAHKQLKSLDSLL